MGKLHHSKKHHGDKKKLSTSTSPATPSTYLQQLTTAWLLPCSIPALTINRSSINLPPATVAWLLPCSIPALIINITYHQPQLHQLASSNHGMAPSLLHLRTHHQPNAPSTATPSTYLQ
jgi:hypothetical protein